VKDIYAGVLCESASSKNDLYGEGAQEYVMNLAGTGKAKPPSLAYRKHAIEGLNSLTLQGLALH
jgi:hypothetical protein